MGNLARLRHHGADQFRHPEDNLSGMFGGAEEQKGSVSFGDVQAGRNPVALPSLWLGRREIL